MPTLFCFGLSYSAAALLSRLRQQGAGWSFAGTCRDPVRAAAWQAQGVTVCPVADGLSGLPASALAGVDHILISVPPDEAGDPVLRACADTLTASSCRWLGYLSTTAVYGDHGGDWVDETTALTPTSIRAERRVLAEQQWLAWGQQHSVPVHLFRLAGIYGLGRSILDDIRAGTAQRVIKPGQMFSRIHVADIAATLAASMAAPCAGAAYNVADDEPAASPEVIAYGCHLLGVAPPPELPFAQATLSPMARSFWADNKRVSNRRIRTELGVSLLAPTYREGLRWVLQNGG